MTYARFDDRFWMHRKVLKVGPNAAWMWAASIGYCNANLTDGFVPRAMLPTLSMVSMARALRLAAKLVDARMWETAEGGWRVHDFVDWNQTAAEVMAAREALSEKRRKAGLAGGLRSGRSRRKISDEKRNENETKTNKKSNENETVSDRKPIGNQQPEKHASGPEDTPTPRSNEAKHEANVKQDTKQLSKPSPLLSSSSLPPEEKEEIPHTPLPELEAKPPEGTPPASPVAPLEPDWDQVQKQVERERFEQEAWEVFDPQPDKGKASVPQELVLEPPSQPDLPGVLEPEQEVFDHWREVMDHPEAKLTKDRRTKVKARLAEGYTVEHLLDAIDGCKKSKFHMGENPERRKHDDLTLICRSASKVDQFRGYYLDSQPKPVKVDEVLVKAREAVRLGKLRLAGGTDAK